MLRSCSACPRACAVMACFEAAAPGSRVLRVRVVRPAGPCRCKSGPRLSVSLSDARCDSQPRPAIQRTPIQPQQQHA
eukprot:8407168-Alexandrium_andersonii.AAC.1